MPAKVGRLSTICRKSTMSKYTKALSGLASEFRKAAWVAAGFSSALGYFKAHEVLGAVLAVAVWAVVEGMAFVVTVLASPSSGK